MKYLYYLYSSADVNAPGGDGLINACEPTGENIMLVNVPEIYSASGTPLPESEGIGPNEFKPLLNDNVYEELASSSTNNYEPSSLCDLKEVLESNSTGDNQPLYAKLSKVVNLPTLNRPHSCIRDYLQQVSPGNEQHQA